MDKKSKYFYAFDTAYLYDDTIEAVVPNYRLMNEAILSFLRYVYPRDSKLKFQDIGIGTGNESIPILKNFPNSSLVAWDFSENMSSEFLLNASNNNIGLERYTYLIKDYLKKEKTPNEYNLVISAYCIHHYPLEIKYQFFKNIFEDLKDNSYFILIDLTSFKEQEISFFSHIYDLNFIKTSFDESKIKSMQNIDKKTKDYMKNEWLYHMENENILDTSDIQMKILLELGFSYVECLYKFFQHSIIIAKK